MKPLYWTLKTFKIIPGWGGGHFLGGSCFCVWKDIFIHWMKNFVIGKHFAREVVAAITTRHFESPIMSLFTISFISVYQVHALRNEICSLSIHQHNDVQTEQTSLWTAGMSNDIAHSIFKVKIEYMLQHIILLSRSNCTTLCSVFNI